VPNGKRLRNAGGRSVPDELAFVLWPQFGDPHAERGTAIRLEVGPDVVFEMLPNPVASRTAIRPSSFRDLVQRGLAPAHEPRRVMLRHLSIAGQPVPDLEARVSVAVGRLGFDGVLGFDFFARFDEVLWRPGTGEMILRSL
jgi:hypothetical protein